jgi:hypothetical protein
VNELFGSGEFSRAMAGFGEFSRVLARQNSAKLDIVCAELLFSAAGFDLCNCLILRER